MLLNDTQKNKIKELYNLYKKDLDNSEGFDAIFGSKATETNLIKYLKYHPEKGLDLKVWRYINKDWGRVTMYSLGDIILINSGCPSFSYRRELNIDTDSLSNILCPKLAKFHNRPFEFYRKKAKVISDKQCPYITYKSIT